MIPRSYPEPGSPARTRASLAPWFALAVVIFGIAQDKGWITLEAGQAQKHRTHHRAKRHSPAAAPLAKVVPPAGPADGNVVRLALAQARRMRASRKVKVALLEAGIVESNLRNLDYGDRDSLGFLQQRPSKGWRCPRNITCATWDFLRRAIPIEHDYPTSGRLAQAVQRSAFPLRYDQHAVEAKRILRAYERT